MHDVKWLYQLQEVDIKIESCQCAIREIETKLGNEEVLVKIRNKLDSESEKLDELKMQQHSFELDIDDITSKIAQYEGQLYSGKITNPKELENLQQEVLSLKKTRSGLEEKALDIMDQVEELTNRTEKIRGDLKLLETEWCQEQRQLSKNMSRIKKELSMFESKRQSILGMIEDRSIELYYQLRERKSRVVVKVVQGICSGCRILLPSVDLQRTRGGSITQCKSCGCILYLD